MAAVPELGRATQVERRVAPAAAATHELYERYGSQIFAFCLHRLRNREEAEDATQQTFLNAFRALRRGVAPEAESAWLFKIAENVCLTRHRASFRRGRVETPGDMQALQDFVASPQRIDADELIQLQDALAGMPANQRKAILLREWQGLSYHEIAEEMELSQSAVETLIFRARRSLAQGLQQGPGRSRGWRPLRHAIDAGTVLAALKTAFAGGAAAKAVATAAAVTTTGALVATSPGEVRSDPRRAVVAHSEDGAAPAPEPIVAEAPLASPPKAPAGSTAPAQVAGRPPRPPASEPPVTPLPAPAPAPAAAPVEPAPAPVIPLPTAPPAPPAPPPAAEAPPVPTPASPTETAPAAELKPAKPEKPKARMPQSTQPPPAVQEALPAAPAAAEPAPEEQSESEPEAERPAEQDQPTSPLESAAPVDDKPEKQKPDKGK